MLESFNAPLMYRKTYYKRQSYLSKQSTCPVSLTMILSLCRSPMPRTYVATQQPAQEWVKSSIALSNLHNMQHKKKGHEKTNKHFQGTERCIVQFLRIRGACEFLLSADFLFFSKYPCDKFQLFLLFSANILVFYSFFVKFPLFCEMSSHTLVEWI